MSINAIVGGQWGDEGKGKIVDLLSKDTAVVARYQGGANAGHTVYYNNKKVVLHQIPTGILRKKSKCILGKGMVIDPVGIVEEIQCLRDNNVNFKDRVFIDFYAHVVTPIHKLIDKTNELRTGNKIGTTCKGIGPTYKDKYDRIGIRMVDVLNFNLLQEKINFRLDLAKQNNEIDDVVEIVKEIEVFYQACKSVSRFVHDTFPILYDNLHNKILIEGAQGTLLDIDHGTFPFVTSSNCTAGGISTGLGIPGNKLNEVIGIFKAYVTRVGSGPFPTELFDSDGEKLQSLGKEFGATTGRARRCGWFDLAAAKYSTQVNGLTGIALTKLDILDEFESIKVCTHYDYRGEKVKYLSSVLNDLDNVRPIYKEFKGWSSSVMMAQSFSDLPEEAKNYIDFLEQELQVNVQIISVGPQRDQILLK
tara:strand:- start:243 stop:1499 length:1257 start_codon:yes stop_codon:yes gene_type:complete